MSAGRRRGWFRNLTRRLWVRISLAFAMLLFVVLAIPSLTFGYIVRQYEPYINDASFGHPGDGGFGPSGENPFGDLAEGAPPRSFVATTMGRAFLFTGIIGLLLIVWVSRGLTRPVTELVDATRQISLNRLDTRVHVRGVTELEELGESFNAMMSELEQAQHQRQNLLADVSHELLTPLTVLQGNLRAMLDGVYAMDAEEIGQLYDQTQHMHRLINDLRQLSQAEAGQLPLQRQPVDLAGLAAEAAGLFAPLAAEQGVALTVDASDHLPALNLDRDRMRQVLSNLINNALRHTPSGGSVTVALRRAAGSVTLAVRDTGDGLTPDELATVFDRFVRGSSGQRRDRGGAGLGLAIVRAVVYAHGGSVAVTSPGPGQGATFTLTLPLRPA